MNEREQDREAEIRHQWERRYGGQLALSDDALSDIAWLLHELARLRTEAHQMQEANAALQAQLDERYPTAKARVE